MHELVARIKKPELCYVFAKNATERGRPELALEAYRHAVELRAAEHEVDSEAELMALKAFYAYEEAMSWQQGKRKRATGTWQMVNKIGILPALIKRLESGGIRLPQILERIRSVPRHLFVDEALSSRAYEDNALPIGQGQTISQPFVVALMTQALPAARAAVIGSSTRFTG